MCRILSGKHGKDYFIPNGTMVRTGKLKQMKAAEGVIEELKAQSRLEWVGQMNNIRSRAEKIINSEMIYI
jgi:hypothetical protein